MAFLWLSHNEMGQQSEQKIEHSEGKKLYAITNMGRISLFSIYLTCLRWDLVHLIHRSPRYLYICIDIRHRQRL